MFSLSKVVGVISCSLLTFLVALAGCQSTTGKTASQTMSDASISTAVPEIVNRIHTTSLIHAHRNFSRDYNEIVKNGTYN
jgi:hypothetical protein